MKFSEIVDGLLEGKRFTKPDWMGPSGKCNYIQFTVPKDSIAALSEEPCVGYKRELRFTWKQ